MNNGWHLAGDESISKHSHKIINIQCHCFLRDQTLSFLCEKEKYFCCTSTFTWYFGAAFDFSVCLLRAELIFRQRITSITHSMYANHTLVVISFTTIDHFSRKRFRNDKTTAIEWLKMALLILKIEASTF